MACDLALRVIGGFLRFRKTVRLPFDRGHVLNPEIDVMGQQQTKLPTPKDVAG
jgi:hypothetical protein